jgi:hypothetical protein
MAIVLFCTTNGYTIGCKTFSINISLSGDASMGYRKGHVYICSGDRTTSLLNLFNRQRPNIFSFQLNQTTRLDVLLPFI